MLILKLDKYIAILNLNYPICNGVVKLVCFNSDRKKEKSQSTLQVCTCFFSVLHVPSKNTTNIFFLILVSVSFRLPGRGRGRGGNPNFQSPVGPQQTPGGRRVRSELKTPEQILKQRKKHQKHQFLQSGGLKNLRNKNKQWVGEVNKSGFGRGGQKKGKMRKRLWGGPRGATITEGWWREIVEMEGVMKDWMMNTILFPNHLK